MQLRAEGQATTSPDAEEAAVRFIALDRLGAIGGLVFVLFANGLFVREPGVWLVVPVLLVLVGGLSLAAYLAEAGRLIAALVGVTVSNWFAALGVSFLFPFLWPVMALTVLMPLVAATPIVGQRQIRVLIAAAAIAAGGVAVTGLLFDDEGVIEDLDDGLELAVVVGSLVAQIVPIGVAIWQNNSIQGRSLARVAATNNQLTRSEADLARSRRRLVEVADAERSRIERDLHDGAQQRLVALGVRLRLLQSQLEPDAPVHGTVEHITGELDAALEELRELAHGIYPPVLQTRGLAEALEGVARRSVAVEIDVCDVGRLQPAVEAAMYFTALEAVGNAQKHAPGSPVRISLETGGGQVALTVADSGPGFAVEELEESHGLVNMRDRISSVGGTLEIVSGPTGTTVTARVEA